MPYEVRGGTAIHASRLWRFVRSVSALEQAVFGTHLHDHGAEIKGSKLLQKDRFKWSRQDAPMPAELRRKHALNFLGASAQERRPRRIEFTAYGQACLDFVEQLIGLLRSHDAKLFASFIPPQKRPEGVGPGFSRKDIVFLIERYFYFLEDRSETGLLVMDRTEKASDRAFMGRMERYFNDTGTGVFRAQRVVPAPLFVDSDMAYGVQAADVCIYILNWGRRLRGMTGPVRDEVRGFADLLEHLEWSAVRRNSGGRFQTRSVFFVPDPYRGRSVRR